MIRACLRPQDERGLRRRCAPDLQNLNCWLTEGRIERKTLGRWLLRDEPGGQNSPIDPTAGDALFHISQRKRRPVSTFLSRRGVQRLVPDWQSEPLARLGCLAKRRIAKGQIENPGPPCRDDFARSEHLRSLLALEDRGVPEDFRKARSRPRGRSKRSCDRGRPIRRGKEAGEQPLRPGREPTPGSFFPAQPCGRRRREPMFFRRLRCPGIRPRVRPRIVCEFARAFSKCRCVRLPASWLPFPASPRRPATIFLQSSPRRFPTVCGYRGRSREGSRTADATPARCDAVPFAKPSSCGWSRGRSFPPPASGRSNCQWCASYQCLAGLAPELRHAVLVASQFVSAPDLRACLEEPPLPFQPSSLGTVPFH